mgnify:CR=1 FL=1
MRKGWFQVHHFLDRFEVAVERLMILYANDKPLQAPPDKGNVDPYAGRYNTDEIIWNGIIIRLISLPGGNIHHDLGHLGHLFPHLSLIINCLIIGLEKAADGGHDLGRDLALGRLGNVLRRRTGA